MSNPTVEEMLCDEAAHTPYFHDRQLGYKHNKRFASTRYGQLARQFQKTDYCVCFIRIAAPP